MCRELFKNQLHVRHATPSHRWQKVLTAIPLQRAMASLDMTAGLGTTLRGSELDKAFVGPRNASGQRHGRGTYRFPNQFYRYEGDFVHGEAHGRGRLSMADGGYYEVLREAFEAKSERARVAETSAGDGACVKASKGWDENVGAAIERDLSRTFPNHEFFAAATTKGADGRRALANILKAYAIHDTKVGYCQGMAFVAGVLLIYLSENRAFAAFVTLMESSDFRSMYLRSMEGLKTRLRQLAVVLRVKNATLAQHLEKHDVAPVLYASGWFMSAFASDFPVRFSGRVMDCLLAQRSPSLIMRICISFLNEAAVDLLKLDDFEAIVVYLKTEPRAWPRERLNAVMESALAMAELTDEAVRRMDAEALAKDDVPRVISPAPSKKKKKNKKKTTGEPSTSTLIDSPEEPPATDDVEDVEDEEIVDVEDEQILDVLALLDLDDWTTLDYSERPN